LLIALWKHFYDNGDDARAADFFRQAQLRDPRTPT